MGLSIGSRMPADSKTTGGRIGCHGHAGLRQGQARRASRSWTARDLASAEHAENPEAAAAFLEYLQSPERLKALLREDRLAPGQHQLRHLGHHGPGRCARCGRTGAAGENIPYRLQRGARPVLRAGAAADRAAGGRRARSPASRRANSRPRSPRNGATSIRTWSKTTRNGRGPVGLTCARRKSRRPAHSDCAGRFTSAERLRPGSEPSSRLTPYLYVLPLVALLAFVFGYPLVRIFEFSFKMVRGIDGPWIGLRNYELVLAQALFWESVRHNLKLLLAVPLMVVWSLLVSVVLYERVEGLEALPRRPVPALHPGDSDHRRRDEEDVPVQRPGERGAALARPGFPGARLDRLVRRRAVDRDAADHLARSPRSASSCSSPACSASTNC